MVGFVLSVSVNWYQKAFVFSTSVRLIIASECSLPLCALIMRVNNKCTTTTHGNRKMSNIRVAGECQPLVQIPQTETIAMNSFGVNNERNDNALIPFV